MKLKFTARLIPVSALLCLVIASCNKNDGIKSPSQSSPTTTNTTSLVAGMENESDLESANVLGANQADADCPVTTFSPAKDVYPHTATIDYGTGCTDSTGTTRSGKRITTVYRTINSAHSGSVVSVTTYSDYYVNGVNITGSYKTSVAKAAVPGPLTLKVIISKVVTDKDLNTSTYIGSTTRKLVEGDPNGPNEDKVWQINTTAYGTEVSGDSTMGTWTYITDPSNLIIKRNDCAFRSQGALKVNVKVNGVASEQVLDYGNGDCDNDATLTVDGTPEAVKLPFFFNGWHL